MRGQGLPETVHDLDRAFQAAVQVIEFLLVKGQLPGQYSRKVLPHTVNPFFQLHFFRHGQLCGRRRGRGPDISHEIGNGKIGFMSNAGNHGNTGTKHCPGHLFGVERSQVFQGTTPPGQEDDIRLCPLIDGFNCIYNLRDSRISLDRDRNDFKTAVGEPTG